MIAVVAGLKMLLELQLVKHRLAAWTLGPQALRHLVSPSLIPAELWLVEDSHDVADEKVPRGAGDETSPA